MRIYLAETVRILERAVKANILLQGDELPSEWRKQAGSKATNLKRFDNSRGQRKKANGS
jgi:hypothetical protein